MKIIDQKRIVAFVTAVEKKKEYVPVPDKVFRHIVSELGELDAWMHRFEMAMNSEFPLKWRRKKIGGEILDIIFLVCYLAKIYKVDLNEIARGHMNRILSKYQVRHRV